MSIWTVGVIFEVTVEAETQGGAFQAAQNKLEGENIEDIWAGVDYRLDEPFNEGTS